MICSSALAAKCLWWSRSMLPRNHCMSFKCTPERFAELIEQSGIIPAPYVARYHWVALERFDALADRELKELVKTAYQLVREKLPKKIQAQLK
jgi:predicted DNA-binding protein (MmcQ/YjbR family)